MEEKDLKSLFDFQHFSKNKKLDSVIDETLGSDARELTPDELSQVNAAGAVYNHTGVLVQTARPSGAGYCEYTDVSKETKWGKYAESVGPLSEAEKEAQARQWCAAHGFTFVKLG